MQLTNSEIFRMTLQSMSSMFATCGLAAENTKSVTTVARTLQMIPLAINSISFIRLHSGSLVVCALTTCATLAAPLLIQKSLNEQSSKYFMTAVKIINLVISGVFIYCTFIQYPPIMAFVATMQVSAALTMSVMMLASRELGFKIWPFV